MILLRDIQDYVDTLGVSDNTYCGKMADKQEKAIGVYHLKSGRIPTRALGGDENRSYERKGISFLVHWTESPTESEKAAGQFYEALTKCRNVMVNEHEILFVELNQEEPVSVDTDENGIYEYVVECIFYMRKEK